MGLSFVKPDVNINFVGLSKLAFMISLAFILIGIASLVIKGGPRYGIDFAGGLMVQLKFDKEVDLNQLKDSLAGAQLPNYIVQRFGAKGDSGYLVRVSATDIATDEVRTKVNDSLKQGMPDTRFDIQRLEMVGPKVGADLREKALEAMFFAVLLISIYISGRFEQRWWAAAIMAGALATGMYALGLLNLSISLLTLAAMIITLVLCWYLKLNFALGAVVALIHDVLITVGIFSILNKEFDLTVVAALLTIIGYSLNDTIIVYDRIRENIRSKLSPSFREIINRSINQTLSRTVLTSGTTLLVVFALFLFGGGVIHDFALALLIGIGVGTYSSIFIASPVLLALVPREDIREGKA